MIYLVTYTPDNKYLENSNLIEKIKSYPAWLFLNTTSFLISVSSKQNARDIKEELYSYLYPEDKIFVSRFGQQAAWEGYGSYFLAWLKQNDKDEPDSEQQEYSAQTSINTIKAMKETPHAAPNKK